MVACIRMLAQTARRRLSCITTAAFRRVAARQRRAIECAQRNELRQGQTALQAAAVRRLLRAFVNAGGSGRPSLCRRLRMTTQGKPYQRRWDLDWVVVANAARARVFERDDENQALREIADHVHTPSRQKATELTGDRPGHAHKSAVSTAFAPHTDAREREHQRFAHEVAQMLEEAALARRMPGLVLLASNPFLGELRAELGDAARRLLKHSAPVDLTTFQHAELEQRVTRAIGNPTVEG
jgi:protein required for attachment to host cells